MVGIRLPAMRLLPENQWVHPTIPIPTPSMRRCSPRNQRQLLHHHGSRLALVKASQDKTAFYTPSGKKHWTVLPMGATNAHPFFIAMINEMQAVWNDQAETRDIKLCSSTINKRGKDDPDAKTIVEDVILYAYTVESLLRYFEVVLEVLEFYRVTVKLRKCRFVQQEVEFVGMDILSQGSSPAKSKDEAFHKLTYPKSFTDLRGFIGFLGFYQDFLPFYEVRIEPYCLLLKEAPSPGAINHQEEADQITKAWTDDHSRLFDDLQAEASASPLLARPSDEKRFYLRTDWSCKGRGAMLGQPNGHPDAIDAMNREIAGGKCEFDTTLNDAPGRLRPISFISKRVTTKSERALHSFMGEAGTGVWAMEKYRFYLFGKEFNWICGCSSLSQFFESAELPTHQAQRWKLFMLRFDFTIVHPPDRMMRDVDMLSRYRNIQTRKHP
jgi:hypothetical protein